MAERYLLMIPEYILENTRSYDLLKILLPLDYRYGSLKHFANGKVWVGTDNQVHDAPSHNCTTLNRCIMLNVENFEI